MGNAFSGKKHASDVPQAEVVKEPHKKNRMRCPPGDPCRKTNGVGFILAAADNLLQKHNDMIFEDVTSRMMNLYDVLSPFLNYNPEGGSTRIDRNREQELITYFETHETMPNISYNILLALNTINTEIQMHNFTSENYSLLNEIGEAMVAVGREFYNVLDKSESFGNFTKKYEEVLQRTIKLVKGGKVKKKFNFIQPDGNYNEPTRRKPCPRASEPYESGGDQTAPAPPKSDGRRELPPPPCKGMNSKHATSDVTYMTIL